MTKKDSSVFQVASTKVKAAIDFCPSGCVNLHIDSAVIHLRVDDFMALQATAAEVAEYLRKKAALAVGAAGGSGDLN